MKNNKVHTHPPLKKPRRKRGRPAKYKNPVGRPKKFANPVKLHLVFEKRTIDYIDALVLKLKEEGVDTTRSEVIRVCIANSINVKGDT